MGESHRDGGALLERGAEIAGIDGLLAAACDGRGGVVVIEGPAGIGKSALLRACAQRAAARGMQSLQARGDDVSMESSFAATRELLAPVADAGAFSGSAGLAAPVFTGEAEVTPEADRAIAVLHGLYWLIADHCDRGAVALLVDDAHWLDPASARFLLYLARRIESLAAVLVVAQRRGEVSGPLAALTEQASLVLAPAPLSPDGSGELVRRELGPRADEDLCRSCHEATGGNPFYLRELVADLRSEGRRPSVDVARSVRSLGAGTVGRSVSCGSAGSAWTATTSRRRSRSSARAHRCVMPPACPTWTVRRPRSPRTACGPPTCWRPSASWTSCTRSSMRRCWPSCPRRAGRRCIRGRRGC